MVSRDMNSPRPSSNGSCTMVTPAEINGYSYSKGKDTPEKSGHLGSSPLSVKEEPTDDHSPNGNVSALLQP